MSELITMCSPMVTVPNVLHDAPQGGDETRVLREHGANNVEEYGDTASKTSGGSSGSVSPARTEAGPRAGLDLRIFTNV